MNKSVLIVGVGSGLSASLARLCTSKNMNVVLAARNIGKLTPLANETRSVNTIYKENENGVDVVIGDNTDVGGFKQSL